MEQQLFQEFGSYPKAKQFKIIRQLAKIYAADLKKHVQNGDKLSTEEEEIINRLRRIGALDAKIGLTEN